MSKHSRYLLPSLSLSVLLGFLLMVVIMVPASATTVAPPANLGHLIRLSDAVVFAEAIFSRVDENSDIPYTVTRFQTLRPIAGLETGLLFEVREPGGAGPTRAAAVAGAPRYQDGKSYLLFLDAVPDGLWQSKMMAYGLLEENPATGLLSPLPEAESMEVLAQKSYEPVGIYLKEELLQHLQNVARGAPWNGRQVTVAFPTKPASATPAVTGAEAVPPSDCRFMFHQADGFPIRWFGYETGATSRVRATTPGQTGISDGGTSAVQAAVGAWANHLHAAIRFVYDGVRARNITCTSSFDFDNGGVVFNDPCSEIPDLSGCAGTLAFGGSSYEITTRLYDASPWHAALSIFAVVNNGSQCIGEVNFREMMAHELGHAQGFGHHNPPNALMSATLKGNGLGANLLATDRICANFAYHTFLDVPYARWSWPYIEAIENARIDTGCGSGNYCPDLQVNRAGMAVFLVRGEHGGTFVPPAATGTVFADVPANHPQAAYIEQLFRDGLTSGCSTSPRLFCPTSLVTRAQMAVFLILAGHGSTYTPPPATGTVFQDVPASYWAAAYIEQLFADGSTAGCATNPRRFCPELFLTREEISGFLTRVYNLPLP